MEVIASSRCIRAQARRPSRLDHAPRPRARTAAPGQPREPLAQRIDQRAHVARPGRTDDLDEIGVGLRFTGFSHGAEQRPMPASAQAARTTRRSESGRCTGVVDRIVDRVAYRLGLTARAQRTR